MKGVECVKKWVKKEKRRKFAKLKIVRYFCVFTLLGYYINTNNA